MGPWNVIGFKFIQSPSKFCIHFPNTFCGLSTPWIREINPKEKVNIPSGAPGHVRKVIAVCFTRAELCILAISVPGKKWAFKKKKIIPVASPFFVIIIDINSKGKEVKLAVTPRSFQRRLAAVNIRQASLPFFPFRS